MTTAACLVLLVGAVCNATGQTYHHISFIIRGERLSQWNNNWWAYRNVCGGDDEAMARIALQHYGRTAACSQAIMLGVLRSL